MIFPIKNWEGMLGWPDNINYDFWIQIQNTEQNYEQVSKCGLSSDSRRSCDQMAQDRGV